MSLAQLYCFLIFWKLWQAYSWSCDFFLLGIHWPRLGLQSDLSVLPDDRALAFHLYLYKNMFVIKNFYLMKSNLFSEKFLVLSHKIKWLGKINIKTSPIFFNFEKFKFVEGFCFSYLTPGGDFVCTWIHRK